MSLEAADSRLTTPSVSDLVRKSRKSYQSPRLKRYGSVAKLTQNGGASGTDFMGMMSCL